jgi:hypothetical protein
MRDVHHGSGLVSVMGALALGEGRACESPYNQQRKTTPFCRTGESHSRNRRW